MRLEIHNLSSQLRFEQRNVLKKKKKKKKKKNESFDAVQQLSYWDYNTKYSKHN
jgi:hypothetical protein